MVIISIQVIDNSIMHLHTYIINMLTSGNLYKGCWSDVKPHIKILVERCGCSAANRVVIGVFSVVVGLFLSAYFLT